MMEGNTLIYLNIMFVKLWKMAKEKLWTCVNLHLPWVHGLMNSGSSVMGLTNFFTDAKRQQKKDH
jgi:hypothetical protein